MEIIMKKTDKIILKGKKVIGGVAEGEALVSRMPLMGWGNVAVRQGYTVERNHPLYEVPFKGKVVVFTEPRGSGGFMGYGAMGMSGNAPLAFLYRKGNNLTIFAAMIARIPTVTEFDKDPTEVIETGDWVKVDGDRGIVEITKKHK
jgi:uncharacterized protein